MKNDNQKKAVLARLNKMKYYVRRLGVLKAGKKILLPMATAMALNISNIHAQERPSPHQDRLPETPELPTYGLPNDNASSDNNGNLLAYERKVVFDIDSEVDKRADWFISNFLDAARKHLYQISHTSNKTAYIKKNFFDVVSPYRNLPGTTAYCITALNRALIDANSFGGDLDGVLPNPNTKECYSANECNAFASHLRKKGFGDCIESGKIDFNRLKPGDILLTVRNNQGSRHARQYIGKSNGKHYCLNFNTDGIRELTNTSAIVIHMKKLTRKAILLKMERENLISDHKGNFDSIIPMEAARRIQLFLYQGREGIMPNHQSTDLYAQNEEQSNDKALTRDRKAFAKRHTNTNLYAKKEKIQTSKKLTQRGYAFPRRRSDNTYHA